MTNIEHLAAWQAALGFAPRPFLVRGRAAEQDQRHAGGGTGHQVGDDAEREDWRFAPLLADDHSALAPAMIVVAGYDPLRDEGLGYAERLRAAGTPVELLRHDGQIHAFWSLGGIVREAAHSIAHAAAFLRERLGVD